MECWDHTIVGHGDPNLLGRERMMTSENLALRSRRTPTTVLRRVVKPGASNMLLFRHLRRVLIVCLDEEV